MLSRRGLIGSLLTAPFVVRSTSIMRVRRRALTFIELDEWSSWDCPNDGSVNEIVRFIHFGGESDGPILPRQHFIYVRSGGKSFSYYLEEPPMLFGPPAQAIGWDLEFLVRAEQERDDDDDWTPDQLIDEENDVSDEFPNPPEIERVEDFDFEPFACLRCGENLTLYPNGGEGDEVDCCGLHYQTEHVQTDLVVTEKKG